MSIKIEHLNYVYSEGTAYEKHALKDICLEIPHGEFVGIIGHTGSGKSTLIQHLNGLIKGTSGAIYYNGKNIYQDGYDMRALRSQVGLVFQYPEHQLFEIDVLTDVCFGPKNQGLSQQECEARALEALKLVGLKEKYYKSSPLNSQEAEAKSCNCRGTGNASEGACTGRADCGIRSEGARRDSGSDCISAQGIGSDGYSGFP